MLVRDLKKGMLLKFSPKISVEYDDRFCGFFRMGDDYLFFSRTGYVQHVKKCEGPFVYLGHRYVRLSQRWTTSALKPARRSLVREVLCDGRVCTVWGYDFRHLEPID